MIYNFGSCSVVEGSELSRALPSKARKPSRGTLDSANRSLKHSERSTLDQRQGGACAVVEGSERRARHARLWQILHPIIRFRCRPNVFHRCPGAAVTAITASARTALNSTFACSVRPGGGTLKSMRRAAGRRDSEERGVLAR